MAVFLTGAGVLPDFSKALSDYAVGESVFLNVNGTPAEFLVVQQGLPSSVYDASCDGTWLLMKDCVTTMKWDTTDNNYGSSDAHAYLNGTFLGLLDSGVQGIIKQAKIPYTNSTNGSPAKSFLLSHKEVNGNLSLVASSDSGAVLDYFETATNSDKVAFYNGTAKDWWLRTNKDTNYAIMVDTSGKTWSRAYTNVYGIRPCIILPYDTTFDPDTNEVIV